MINGVLLFIVGVVRSCLPHPSAFVVSTQGVAHQQATTWGVQQVCLPHKRGFLFVPMCDRVLFFRQSGRRRFMQNMKLFITQDDSMGIHSPSTMCDCVLFPRHQGRRRFMQNTKLFIHQQDDSMEIHLRLKWLIVHQWFRFYSSSNCHFF